METKYYEKNSFSSLDDLNYEEWKSSFKILSELEEEIFNYGIHSEDYIWPRKPLRNQTRPWEYPYVYNNIKKFIPLCKTPNPSIIDLGSGFTFFPYSLNKLGGQIICVDMDPIPGKLYSKANSLLNIKQSSLEFKVGDLNQIPMENESVDIAYSISVLEHLPQIDKVIEETHRILKKGSYFVLTFDIDLQGNFEIGPDKWNYLRKTINERFIPIYPEVIIHPQKIMTNLNHPYVVYKQRNKMSKFLRGLYHTNKDYLRKYFSTNFSGYYITTFGGCYIKK
jgi:ubiquinone/menaquinone biosynthesis C-methylase UbiE